jgi:hypothetical protein
VGIDHGPCGWLGTVRSLMGAHGGASYASWVRCLANAEVCPLTKKPLKRSDLVLLTHDNIDRYRDRIVQ